MLSQQAISVTRACAHRYTRRSHGSADPESDQSPNARADTRADRRSNGLPFSGAICRTNLITDATTILAAYFSPDHAAVGGADARSFFESDPGTNIDTNGTTIVTPIEVNICLISSLSQICFIQKQKIITCVESRNWT